MKIVIAPDSFKGSIRSPEVCNIIAKSYKTIFPKATIIELPMADGGEGTTEALVSALKGKTVQIKVNDPLGNIIDASYGLIDNGETAIMEMASASGIELVALNDLNPMKTTTFGTGEMIVDAILNKKVKKIIIGIGGSATVDGGIGMAQALGFNFLDKNGKECGRGGDGLINICKISNKNVIPELKNVEIKVASDVTNPLNGKDGAAYVYGPQKGATPSMIKILDNGLNNLMNICLDQNMINSPEAGDGAAGGLGIALRAFCKAELTSGAKLICEAVKLSEHLQGADLLITGEGATDSQTLSGKLCSVVANYAKKENVPVMLISGALKIREELFDMVDYAFSISLGEVTLEAMLKNSKKNLAFCAINSAKLYKK